MPALKVDGSRLWNSLMELAKIGATPKGGVCRLTLSDLDRQGRDRFSAWANEAGLSVRCDAIGNIFATDRKIYPPFATRRRTICPFSRSPAPV